MDKHEKQMIEWYLLRNALIAASMAFMGLMMCAVLGSCTSTRYVPVETVRTEYRDRVTESVRVDTVALRDSVAVYINGDTVRITRYRDRWRDRVILKRDTLSQVKTDSIAVPYPVERSLTRWEKVKQDAGGIAIGGVLVVLCAAVVWLTRKLRK